MATSQNTKNIAAFNAEFETLTCVSHTVPFVGGESARFYRSPANDGWLIHEIYGAAGSGTTTATRISAAVVNKADAVELDVYNNAAAARSYLAIANA